jgi:uncharacterized membrane protein
MDTLHKEMMMMVIIIVIIIIIINNNDRIASTMYPLGTWFVSGICVWIPCIKR